MKFEDLKNLYLGRKKQYGIETYKQMSELLKEAKEIHKRDWLKNPTHEQSWRAFKGKNLEKLVQYIITDWVHRIEVLGNSIVPQVAYQILQAIVNIEKECSNDRSIV